MTKVPGVTDVLFVDRAGAYKAFRQDFADNKELLKATSAKDVPESFRVRVEKGIERDQVEAAVVGQPGVGFSADEAELLPLDERWLNVDIEVHLCLEDSAMPACESGRGAANKAMTTVKEKKAIVAAIKGMPEVTSHTFMDQAAAYRQFATDFEHNEAFVKAVKPSDLPESYRLMVRPEADWNTVSRRLARLKGVSYVFNERCHRAQAKLFVTYGMSAAVGKACAPKR